jgi:hypothetical protein
MPMQSPAQEAVTTEIATLAGCSIHALRDRWQSIFRSEPPPAFGPDLLRRSIAQKLQEDAYGKLPSSAQQELSRIVASLKEDPTARIELRRRIKPGAVLVRDWKGKSKRVMVLDKGFAYEGRTYQSLSEIAREITGTRWNGPKFFGLRSPDKSRDEKSKDNAPPKRGRPPKPPLAVKPSTQTEASNGL